jgi:hypothetical protein
MPKKVMSYSDTVPAGRDVKDTNQLSTTARERNATGTNTQKRATTKHKSLGALGGQGHP